MKYELYLEYPDLPKMINQVGRKHWGTQAKEARKWKLIGFSLAVAKRPQEPLKKCKIHYERHSSAQPDMDNMIISFKHIQDGLKKAGIFLDDNPEVIECTHAWVKAKPSKGKITVRVTSLDEQ